VRLEPSEALDGFVAADPGEAADLARIRALMTSVADPWARAEPLHLTGSALVVHPPTRRILLRWHPRLRRWAQVGGHGDPQDADPWSVALREATEETGLDDLEAWPPEFGRRPLQVVVVPVPASDREPAHEHADVRYLLATQQPEAATPESEDAPLRWMTVEDARDAVREENLAELLRRVDTVEVCPR
jgi:8-oxo-dGTP pyrophosphatase MutT (NUDIX family)